MYLSSRPWAQACNESKKDLRWSSISLIGDWWRNVMRNVIASHDVIEFDVIDSNQLLYPYGTWRTPLCVWSAIRFCFHNFRSIENSFFFLINILPMAPVNCVFKVTWKMCSHIILFLVTIGWPLYYQCHIVFFVTRIFILVLQGPLNLFFVIFKNLWWFILWHSRYTVDIVLGRQISYRFWHLEGFSRFFEIPSPPHT